MHENNFKLNSNEVHTWFYSLEIENSKLQNLKNILSQDELKRAEKFKFHTDRNNYITGRGILRNLLGLYQNIKPEEIEFSYNKYGKPELAKNSQNIHFNLSHSGTLAVYAFSNIRETGIDIEYFRDNFSWEDIVERFFSPHEIAMMHTVPTHLQVKAFFNCWTRKEAYIKAVGMGLSIPLASFDVSLIPEEEVKLLKVRGKMQEPWTLKELKINSDYIASAAVKGQKLNFINKGFFNYFPPKP